MRLADNGMKGCRIGRKGGWGREARGCFDTTMYMITWHGSAKRRKQNSVVISLYERLILKSGPADHKSDRSTFKELPYLVITSFIYTALIFCHDVPRSILC